AREDSALEELAQPALFVPEVASALDLLRLMRERKATEAIVVDEFGGTAGFVTLEHVFEEIVGDLRREGESEEQSVERLDGGRWRVAGHLSIRDWNEQFGRQLVPEGFETVGGFVTALLGRIPRAGDRVRAHGIVMEVREVRARRVAKVDMSVEGPAT
ncbi:MAG: transporter associated domain-containing protein, partial [Planctomycetia bacterium]